MLDQKADESIDEIDRNTLFEYIGSKDFLAVVFCKQNAETRKYTRSLSCDAIINVPDDPEDPDARRVLRHIELIDDEATEYGITIVKSTDKLMAKKYGYRQLPGLTYFRKGKNINYDGDIDDEEEVLDWLTLPDNMEMTDHIERVNRKMFQKIRQTSDYLAVFFCKTLITN